MTIQTAQRLLTREEMDQARESSHTLTRYALADHVRLSYQASNGRADDFMMYKRRIDAGRAATLDELAQFSQQNRLGC